MRGDGPQGGDRGRSVAEGLIWDDSKIVAWDLETSGTLPEYALQPWRVATGDSWLTSTSMIEHNGERLVPSYSGLWPKVETLTMFLEDVVENGKVVVGWNIAFDISWLFALGIPSELIHRVKWLDAMLLLKHLEVEPEYELDRAKKRSFGLKAAVAQYLPKFAGYEDDVDFHATDDASLARLQKYNDRDSVFTWVLAKMFWHKLTDRQRQVALIETECLSMVAQANYEGMIVDTLVARELASHLEVTAEELLRTLAPHGVTETVIRSPTKMAKLLFDDWGLPVYKENVGKKTGKVSRATDKEVLHELAFADPRCKELKEYREALNNKTKFADAPLISADYNGDGRTHPAARVFSTYSGRLTYSSKQGEGKDEKPIGFALHQEKRDKFYRSIIVSPPGYTLVEFDAAAQEYRWMAIMSGDPVMQQLCQPGEDPHSYMAARILRIDYKGLQDAAAAEDKKAESDRHLGKFSNLSCQFRTGPKTLRSKARVQYGIPLEMPQTQLIHKTFQQTYQRVPSYWERQIALTRKQGYAETIAGRRVKVTGDWNGSLGWAMESTAIIMPIQGTGADQKYLALKAIKDELAQVGGQFAWELHDGVYLYIPDSVTDRFVVDMKRKLDNLPYREAWGFDPPIPLTWDAKTAKSWGSLKAWKE